MKWVLIAGYIILAFLLLWGLLSAGNGTVPANSVILILLSLAGFFGLGIYQASQAEKRKKLREQVASSATRETTTSHSHVQLAATSAQVQTDSAKVATPPPTAVTPEGESAPAPSAASIGSTSSPAPPSPTISAPKPEVQEVVPMPVAAAPTGPVVTLGRDIETRQAVTLAQAARLQGLYIIGVNGTGKSTFISNLIVEDMKQGLGLMLLDPHGDLTKDVLARVPDNRQDDVILLDLMDSAWPFGLNLFECSAPDDPELVALSASFVMHVFAKVWGVGTETPLLAQTLRNVTFTLLQNPGTTIAEVPLLLQEKDVREKLTSNVTNSQVRLFWRQYDKLSPRDQMERTSSTLNKVDAFLSQPIINNIVGQPRTTIDFREIMDTGKILLVQLTPRLEDLSSLVGAVMIGQLLAAAMSRKELDKEERRQFNLYADEYQRFATEDFATLLSEARKFGVATTIAHQYLEQLDEVNRGASVNAANLVVFRVSGQDAELLAKEFDATPEESLEEREVPVRSPVQNVLEHLLKKGHRDSDVTSFTNMYLTRALELFENRENYITHPQSESYNDFEEFLKRPSMMSQAIETMKELLFLTNRDQKFDWDFPPEFLFAWLFINEVSGGVRPLVKFNPQQGLSGSVRYGPKPVKFSSTPEFDSLCRPAIYAGNRIEVLRDYVAKGNKGKEDAFNEAMEFISHLRQTLQALADDPIMVDTGQYRIVKDKPRPYADVQKEIANKLTNAPNYQARIKTLAGQHTITTLPQSPGLIESDIEARRGEVLNRTHGAYCLPRSVVVTEIEQRQAILLEAALPEPKSRRQIEPPKEFKPSRRQKTPPTEKEQE